MLPTNMLLPICMAFMLIGNYIFVLAFIKFRISKRMVVMYLCVLAGIVFGLQYNFNLKYINFATIANTVFMPCINIVVFYFIVQYPGWRLVFNIMVIHIVSACIYNMASCVGILAGNDYNVQLFAQVIIYLLTAYFLYGVSKSWKEIIRELDTNWFVLSGTTILCYIIVIIAAYYPKPLSQRKEYIVLCMLISVLMYVMLLLFIWIIKQIQQLNESEQQKIVLKTQLELQEGRLKLEQVYREMAYTDIMTGLLNRTAYEEAISHLEAKMTEVTIISVDLNNLKIVNDEQGHQSGDQFIIDAAKMLQQAFEDKGRIFRIGGDEFVIIVEEDNQLFIDACLSMLEKLLDNHRNPRLTMAVGYAKRNGKEHLWHLLKRADAQMYANKIAYKNSL